MDYLKQRRVKRVGRLFVIFTVCFLVLFGRLFVIQIEEGPKLAQKAQGQQNIIIGLEEVPRGDILDRNGVPFTGTEKNAALVIFPHLIKDKKNVGIKLAEVLNLPEEALWQHNENLPFVIKDDMVQEKTQYIERLNLPGVQVHYFKKRYEDKPLAVNLIGHLGRLSEKELLHYRDSAKGKEYKPSDLVGKMGLEKYYESELKGTCFEEWLSLVTDAWKRPLKGLAVAHRNNRDVKRKHLVLTIDKNIQSIVEDIMDNRQITDGAVVVMDVVSGDILAMASRPCFNPDNVADSLRQLDEGNVFLDNCLQLVQPGSVFKPVIAAAALDQRIIGIDSPFICLGAEDDLVKCNRAEGHGIISFPEAMAHSCNPFFARAGQRLGTDTIIEYVSRLGLDKQDIIGYPFPPDSRQDFTKLREPYTIINSSLGQGPVLVNPVQITAMTATFARGGIYKTPRLVMEILEGRGRREQIFAPATGVTVINDFTCNAVKQMFSAVTEYGTGQLAYVPGFGSAGKTGSAQVDKSRGVVDAWFTGYAPEGEGEFVVTVLIKGGESGGKAAAPIFREVMERLLEGR